jgi:hypothetical protein
MLFRFAALGNRIRGLRGYGLWAGPIGDTCAKKQLFFANKGRLRGKRLAFLGQKRAKNEGFQLLKSNDVKFTSHSFHSVYF